METNKEHFSGLKLKRNDLVLLLNDVRVNKFSSKYSRPYGDVEIISLAKTINKKKKQEKFYRTQRQI